MFSDDIAIRVRDVAKHYLIFARPEDRLRQMVVPRMQRLAGRAPSRYYRDFAALSDVTFDIRRGETLGIIGRNGSGKSTLLQIVCGTLRPTHGTVEVKGRIAALLELGAGFNPDFTGRENVYLNAAILGLSRSEIDDRFDSISRFADIGDFIEQPVKTYSSGMYVRLAFATAINVDPDILVVDEALAVGDEAFQRKCFARIEDMQAKGATILFFSHAAPTIVQLCSRALLIDGGELLVDGRPKMVVAWYQRLIHASQERASNVREEIRAVDATVRPHQLDATKNADTAPVIHPFKLARYDPTLQPQSTIDYFSKQARIFNARILDIRDRIVNELVHGERYKFAYNVAFEASFPLVGFGMTIKTTSGVDIGGQGSHNLGSGIAVEAGDVLDVSFPFQNLLLPGTYFCNAGVSAHGNAAMDQLHRVLDIAMFRVIHQDWARPISNIVNLAPIDENVLISRTQAANKGAA